MRNITLIILMLGLLSYAFALPPLPSCYYTYDQITNLLEAHQSQHPDIAKMVQIGVTQQEQIPIYAMRISDNVALDEQEPAVLFIGQVHAEEVLGVQTTMSNIEEILSRRYQLPYNQWISQLDMWFIPTLNPEGHNVVTSNLDTSYRKNKRDNNANGIFDYSPLVGYDVDGVDINRNMSFNWVHGDTLYYPGGWEVYDYYRGPAPMSESEVIALKNLCDRIKFVYSIVWHSSRTGNLSEKCYYPFNWKEVRPSPDLTLAASIGNGLGGQIIKQNGTGTYESSPNLSRKGATHDWMYQQYGTIQVLIECGTQDLQPDSLLMADTVNRCSNATRWLLNRTLRSSSAVPSNSLLTGVVTDAVTQEPLEAQIIIQERNASWFRPRMSYAADGRYYRPLLTGTYTVIARKRGYYDTIVPNHTVNNSSWTLLNLPMTPKEPATLSGHIQSGGVDIPALIVIGDVFSDSLSVDGKYIYHAYQGEYPITIHAEGYYPYRGSVTLSPGANQRSFSLSPIDVVYEETWENGAGGWEIEGPWVVQNELSISGNAITDSWGGNGFYAVGCDVWIQSVQPVNIPSSGNPLLSFDSHLYTEPGFDPVRVQISDDKVQWTTLWEDSGRQDWWQRHYIDLSEHAGAKYLRFRLTDNSNHEELTDPGWTIDNIRIITGTAVSNEDSVNPSQPVITLGQNYPNPFNPSTRISFANAEAGMIRLEIYNIRGQKIKTLINEYIPAGNHRITWNGDDDSGKQVSSGVYLYRIEGSKQSLTRKMLLAK